MSIRFGVNQSIVSLCGASVESVIFSYNQYCIRLCDLLSFCYVINIVMVLFEICQLMCATVLEAHISLLCILFCS